MRVYGIYILNADDSISEWDYLDTETMTAERWDCGRLSEIIQVHDLNVIAFHEEVTHEFEVHTLKSKYLYKGFEHKIGR